MDSPSSSTVGLEHVTMGLAGLPSGNQTDRITTRPRLHTVREGAHVDEYREFAKIIGGPDSSFGPNGTPLLPEPETDSDLLCTLMRDDVQFVAQAMLGRELGDEEMQAVAHGLLGALGWIGAVETTIKVGQATKKIWPAVDELKQEEPVDLEEHVSQLPNSGWPECYEGKYGITAM